MPSGSQKSDKMQDSHLYAASKACLVGDDVDEPFRSLLPWLASRFNPCNGSFHGEDTERGAAPGLLAAQGRACFRAIGLYELLPHIVRTKLDLWPELSAAELAKPASGSPLAQGLTPLLGDQPAGLLAILGKHASYDRGYTLWPDSSFAGEMAAAHHLLVVMRPAWVATRARGKIVFSDYTVNSLTERMLANHSA